MHFILVSFLSPLFCGMAVIIESLLSNHTFKRPTTMIFYISLMNALFCPLVLFWGMPTLPPVDVFACYVVLAAISVGYLYPYYLAMKVIDASIVAALFSLVLSCLLCKRFGLCLVEKITPQIMTKKSFALF